MALTPAQIQQLYQQYYGWNPNEAETNAWLGNMDDPGEAYHGWTPQQIEQEFSRSALKAAPTSPLFPAAPAAVPATAPRTGWLNDEDLTGQSWWDVAQRVNAVGGPTAVRQLMDENFFEQFPSFSAGDRASMWNWVGGETAREQDNGGFMDSGLGKLLGSALVGTNFGATGQAAATGNDIGQGAMIDLAGLAAAPFAAAALPATGLSTLTPAVAAETTAAGSTLAPGLTESVVSAPAAASPSEIGLLEGAVGTAPSEIGFETVAANAAAGTAPAVASLPAAGGASGTALGTAAGTGAGVAGGTAISRILDGSASAADYLAIGGTGAATGLGYLASRDQTQSLERLANEYMALGAPSRARYEESFSPDFKVESIPGYTDAIDTSMQSMLRKLSTQGNPFGNPAGTAEALKYVSGNIALPTIQNYRTQNANTGGYSSFNTAAPTTATSAIGSDANTYNVIGAGIADLTQPRRTSLSDIYRSLA